LPHVNPSDLHGFQLVLLVVGVHYLLLLVSQLRSTPFESLAVRRGYFQTRACNLTSGKIAQSLRAAQLLIRRSISAENVNKPNQHTQSSEMSDAGSRPSSQPSSPVPDSDSESQGSDGASRASSREIDYEWWTWFGDEGDAERPSRYLNAREYPMALNSIIGPSEEYQYKIVAKLGFGGFSTVWMGWGKGEK
jgi:hypothetical protein